MSIKKTNLEVSDFINFISINNYNPSIIITDVPYPFDNKNGKNRFNYDSSMKKDNMYDRLTNDNLREIYSKLNEVSEEGCQAFFFTDRNNLMVMSEDLNKSGWTNRNIIVWNKKKIGMGYHFRNQIEYILYVSKGKPNTFVTSIPNIFEYKKPKGESAKPFEIWRDIMDVTGKKEDNIIIDPFAGTDPLSAAYQSKDWQKKIKLSISNIYTGEK